jgi:hypothetical protein
MTTTLFLCLLLVYPSRGTGLAGPVNQKELNATINLLDRTPSFELLCILCDSANKIKQGAYADYLRAVLPCPVSECTPSRCEASMRILDKSNSALIRALVQAMDARYQKQRPKWNGSYSIYAKSIDDQRKVALLLELAFSVPDSRLCYWKRNANKALVLHPSVDGIPRMMMGFYGELLPTFIRYEKDYGRRLPVE